MSFEHNLYKLRQSANLTQDAFAEQIGVSRQAVQKWESGIARPDLEHVLCIAKKFHISMDALLLDTDRRIAEELSYDRKIQPEYASMHTWESYSAQLAVEYRQCTEEGKDVSQYRELFQAVSKMPPSAEREKIADVLFQLVLHTPVSEDFPYAEPSERNAVLNSRPKASLPLRPLPSDAVLRDKIHGAWLGRICGCLLGKPIEGMRLDELTRLMKETGNYPLHRYFEKKDISDSLRDSFRFRIRERSLADQIDCAPVDDDTNYTVMAQLLVELYGRDFTPYDVSRIWLERQPKSAYCTAERVAFRNFVDGYKPPYSAQYKNPYREWIGAQIRADYYGYINPGDPETAAQMAWRDASVSHVRNGIYGAMFVSAMIAYAAVEDSLEQIILAGLSQIPEKSRLTEGIQEVLAQFRSGKSAKACFRSIQQKFDDRDEHDWCHTVSNAMIVAAALLYGEDDYGRSICLAVEAGFDTDCNGATVGSVLGMRGGSACIGEEWTKPIHGQLDTSVFGVGRVSVPALVEQTMRHIKK